MGTLVIWKHYQLRRKGKSVESGLSHMFIISLGLVNDFLIP